MLFTQSALEKVLLLLILDLPAIDYQDQLLCKFNFYRLLGEPLFLRRAYWLFMMRFPKCC